MFRKALRKEYKKAFNEEYNGIYLLDIVVPTNLMMKLTRENISNIKKWKIFIRHNIQKEKIMVKWKDITPTIGKSNIATGYFRLINQYIEMGYKPVAICGKSPEWYKGVEYKKLAPKIGFFTNWKEGKIDNDEYIKCYYEQVLVKHDPDTVLEIKEKANSNKVVLLCYEKFPDFCHRHIVSYWMRYNGFDVCELDASEQLFKGLFSR